MAPLKILPPKNPKLFFQGNKQAKEKIEELLKKNNLDNKKIICFHVGAYWRNISKRWPLEKFAQLGDKLNEEYPEFKIILLGNWDEKKSAEKVKTLMKDKPLLAMDLTLKETFELMKKSSLFVGNDSGLMHLAAAADIPTIGFFRYFVYFDHYPYNKKSIAITKKPLKLNQKDMQKKEFKWNEKYDEECFKKITVAEVLAATKKLL